MLLDRFHPTLVLAQRDGASSRDHMGFNVSIPHWFSLNTPIGAMLQRALKCFHPTLVLAQLRANGEVSFISSFPSHIGSRSTRRVRPLLSDHAKFPSHIGSRSTLRDGYREGNSLSVSIPHWFSLNEKNLAETRRTETVSIPHWFSLNEKRIRRELIRGYCFHPTLVLAQRQTNGLTIDKKTTFPSHIGSRSTLSFSVVVRSWLEVSIPHWFSLN